MCGELCAGVSGKDEGRVEEKGSLGLDDIHEDFVTGKEKVSSIAVF